ncbi:hypothetical protein QBC42DRAFT_190958 [Cladorrhinum samala]|uniref:GEgh 16 protein n=1 Tax=Cladorrhinum samala TaxID=585594 RepID=A0AAV9H8Q6_9PEZI|nr:hypothetical protein QBC42DRAFT_190958 [Cladorrhinum samala]
MFFKPTSALSLATLFALVEAHAVILAAQGLSGSPPSVGFMVSDAIARNCTSISPCQMDTTIIRDAEIKAGTVNSCGRTKLTGNIDVGEVTEAQLAQGAVTQVQAGSDVNITLHQVNADGAGPYTCQVDETSNSGVFSQALPIKNNIPGVNGLSQAKEQDFNITVTLPKNLKCVGASTGNVCTIRCRNNAQAGPFGGCFAVQQTDVEPNTNTAENIQANDSLEQVDFEAAANRAALPAAIKANQDAGTDEQSQNLKAVEAILALNTATRTFPVVTPTAATVPASSSASSSSSSAAAGTPSATATATPGTRTGRGGRNRNKNNSNNSNAGNGNANAGSGDDNNDNNNNNNDNNNRNRRRQAKAARRESVRELLARFIVDDTDGVQASSSSAN